MWEIRNPQFTDVNDYQLVALTFPLKEVGPMTHSTL